MKRLSIVLLVLYFPLLALATPKVNVVNCLFTRDSQDNPWSSNGWGGSNTYYDIGDGYYDFDYALWTTDFGLCLARTGTSDDHLNLSAKMFVADQIDSIDENCNAIGINVRTIAEGQKFVGRGEAHNLIGKFADGSEILLHLLFTPYSWLGGDILKSAENYCRNLTP